MEWHALAAPAAAGTRSIDGPLEALLAAPFSPLDISYIATRDIAVNEELFLHYVSTVYLFVYLTDNVTN